MKNSLFMDFVNESKRKITEHYDFSVESGGRMDEEQKEKFRDEINSLIDTFVCEFFSYKVH